MRKRVVAVPRIPVTLSFKCPNIQRVEVMKRSATICRLAMVAVYVVGGCMLTDVTWAVPTPVHAYDFNGDLNDGGSGGVAITSEGGTVGDEFYEFNPQLPPGDYNTGLTLATPALSDPG